MRKEALGLASLLLAWLTVPGIAHADDPGSDGTARTTARGTDGGSWTALAARPNVGLEYDLWPASDFVGMMWDVGAHIQLAKGLSDPKDSLIIDGNYAFGYFEAKGVFSVEQAFYGNPTVGAHYTRPLDRYVENLRVYAGLAWTAPALNDPDLVIAFSSSSVSGVRVLFNAARATPYYMAFHLQSGAEYRILPGLYYRGSLNPVLYVPTNGSGDTQFILEQGNELEYRLDMGFGGGVRFQEAFTLTSSDLVQTASELFVAYTPEGPGLYARAGLLVALDEPFGFGFDKYKLASVKLAVGYHLE